MSAIPVSSLPKRRNSLANPRLGVHLNSSQRETDLRALLDQTHEILFEGSDQPLRVGQAMDGLFGGLYWMKQNCPEDEWQTRIQQCREHRVLDLVHEDPFTGRAFRKPRGYAGDAELLDLIYGPEERTPEPQASHLGLNIYRYTNSAPAAEGVRARRAFVADLLDNQAAARPGLSVLAIAAGHLREASMSSAVRRRKLGRFVALDADPVSLQEVDRAYGSYGVETVAAPFSHLITGRVQLGGFDLVYSTGLFDYLNVNTGRRLVRTLFDMLNPRGQLVVANFMPGIPDVGFMEAFMDWRLIYRTRHDMVSLTADIEETEISDLSVFAEESRNIIFSRITKS